MSKEVYYSARKSNEGDGREFRRGLGNVKEGAPINTTLPFRDEESLSNAD